MPAGRPKKPSHLKAIAGTEKPSRVNHAEPQPDIGMPKPPAWLSSAELAHFERIGRIVLKMRVLAESDGEALAMLAAEYQKYLDCRADIEERGHVMVNETAAGTETQKRNPASTIMAEAWRNATALMGRFGLTPSDRSSVTALPKTRAEDPRKKWRK